MDLVLALKAVDAVSIVSSRVRTIPTGSVIESRAKRCIVVSSGREVVRVSIAACSALNVTSRFRLQTGHNFTRLMGLTSLTTFPCAGVVISGMMSMPATEASPRKHARPSNVPEIHVVVMCQACKEEGMASFIIREKGVSCKGVLVQSDPEGNVTVQLGLNDDGRTKFTEDEAIALYENLGNLIEWKS